MRTPLTFTSIGLVNNYTWLMLYEYKEVADLMIAFGPGVGSGLLFMGLILHIGKSMIGLNRSAAHSE